MVEISLAQRHSTTILVLSGGWSSEREVSLNSGKNCADALKKKGWNAIFYDAYGDVKNLVDALRLTPPDLVFNALHGNYGEDGSIAGLLSLMQIPYTHSGIAAGAMAMDKLLTKKILTPFGITFAKSYLLKSHLINKNADSPQEFPLAPPYVLKPVSDGSSRGVHIIMNRESHERREWKMRTPHMIERYVPGRELTVAVLQGRGALGVTELIPNRGFYDYDAKYHDGITTHICPAEISKTLSEKCKQQAELAHEVLGCKQLSRSDFRYSPEEDTLYFLEINTHPGMTELSLVPEQARLNQLSFVDLCDEIVLQALQESPRKLKKQKLGEGL